MNRRSSGRRPLSGVFWRGVGFVVALSVVGYGSLVSGNYKDGVTAPRVAPLVALGITGGLALAAVVSLWRWERSRDDRD